MTKLINSKTFENQKKVKEGFGDPINNFFDECMINTIINDTLYYMNLSVFVTSWKHVF